MILVLIGLVFVIANWKLYTKAGKPGWISIVPIYNTIVLLKLVGKPWWWIFLLLIPLVNFVFGIMLLIAMSKSYSRGTGFVVGLILMPFIFFPVLGLSKKSVYIGPQK